MFDIHSDVQFMFMYFCLAPFVPVMWISPKKDVPLTGQRPARPVTSSKQDQFTVLDRMTWMKIHELKRDPEKAVVDHMELLPLRYIHEHIRHFSNLKSITSVTCPPLKTPSTTCVGLQ